MPFAASRPPSCTSLASGSVFGAGGADAALREPSETASQDGAQQAILGKCQEVEKQVGALEILLSEQHLSLDDQETALQKIRSDFRDLQHQYRDAKDEHEFLRRQGMTPGGRMTPGASSSNGRGGFDESKDLEGAIYRLSMKLDDVDHRVQENLKERPNRKPYAGGAQPMRGDHSIPLSGGGPRASSVDSITPEIDGKMQELKREYAQLMERYQALKLRPRTPERDIEVDRLLQALHEIYEKMPDHSKPQLPPELLPR